MSTPAAACFDDEIKHTPIWGQVLKVATTIGAGLLVGIAIGAAAAFVVGTGGAGAVVLGAVVGAVMGVALDAGMQILTGKPLEESITAPIFAMIDKFFPGVVKGKISTGSHNVNINSKKAARAAGKPSVTQSPSPPAPPPSLWDRVISAVLSVFGMGPVEDFGFDAVDMDKVVCQDHPPAPEQYIAQGSSSVFINGQPAARAGDKSTCEAIISVNPARKGNVSIGGAQVQVRAINSEMPAWLAFVSKWAGFAIAVCQAIRGKGPLLQKILCLGTNMAIGMAADMGVRAIAAGVGAALSGSKGHPVHLPSGSKILLGEDDMDFTVPAQLPLQ